MLFKLIKNPIITLIFGLLIGCPAGMVLLTKVQNPPEYDCPACNCDCPEIPPATAIEMDKVKKGAVVHIHQQANIQMSGEKGMNLLMQKMDSLMKAQKISRCK
jgi:MinD superfamily P-loop ATPase